MDIEQDDSFNLPSIRWTVRLFSRLEKALAVNIRLHHANGSLESGEIYLFNHFARFETFIPQYLIHKQSGVLLRSVASAEFFVQSQTVSRYLRGLGAVPNDHPRLLPFLAAEILRGRKVVIFPEGGMVKDRRVLDAQGEYAVYSRTADRRRKHHSGAAVLGITLDAFKNGLLALHREDGSLRHWPQSLGMTEEALLAAAARPTVIVPGNITFYPLRVDEHALHRLLDSMAGLGPKEAEELLIESNILLRNTDMDLRLGETMHPAKGWSLRSRTLLADTLRRVPSLDHFFCLAPDDGPGETRLVARHLRHRVAPLRDATMHRIYGALTVNLSHLASTLMQHCLREGRPEITPALFHRALFLAIRKIQGQPDVHLHRGLVAPENYAGVIDDTCPGLTDFLQVAEQSHVLERSAASYRFLPKLLDAHAFDAVRIENPVQVYANEAAPVRTVLEAVKWGLSAASDVDAQRLAEMLFEEERAALVWARSHFSRPRFAEINGQETATASADPYWLRPSNPRRLGVLLVHGFLASPAELRPLGERLAELGYPVLGIRLPGHGTSPWDLHQKSWNDWLAAIRRGMRILEPFVERICVIGFSTGGALSLILAADNPPNLAGVVACSPPYKFRNANLLVVPLVHSANQLIRRLSDREGLVVFRPNESEHPHINYRNIPVSALNELRHMVEELGHRLPHVRVPTLLVQGSDDQVVDARGAVILYDKLTAAPWKRLRMVASKRHGILYEDIGDSRQTVIDFLATLPGASR